MAIASLKIANEYGSVKVYEGVPAGYGHVPGARLQPLCRKLGIRYSEAVVGWNQSGRYYSPRLDGVVVSKRSAAQLAAAVRERETRTAPARAARVRRQEEAKAHWEAERPGREARAAAALAQRVEDLAAAIHRQFPNAPDGTPERIARHASEPDSGRVGTADGLDADECARLAVAAHVRHELTNYDELLEEARRWADRDDMPWEVEDARRRVGPEVAKILGEWEGRT